MADQATVRKILVDLREEANISQAELAKRLPFTASRVSRLESGEIGLTGEDAQQVAQAIGTPRAKAFAEYLRQDWRILERPGFNHISREALWEAECALQRLDDLEGDPELKNAFLQQVKSCRQGLERSARFLLSTEHQVAFLGSPGVGKTTAICTLSDLRKPGEKDLNRQMALQTGSGRITICEVHVRNGSDYSIIVDPCSTEELRQYVADFCDHLIGLVHGSGKEGSADGAGVSAEIGRALRNMTDLAKAKKGSKGEDGKTKRDDPALELVQQYPAKEDLQVEIMSRLDIPRRSRTSISLPRDSTLSGLDWVARTFTEINYGRHPEFSLPRRIEVTVPTPPILGAENLAIRLIDTRGIDEPFAPRRDIQAYLDDERTIIVLCSGFKDAPDATMLAMIERAAQGGLRESLLQKGMLLVLPQDGEESAMRDNSTGDTVSSAEEGREIRKDEAVTTLGGHLGTRDLPVEFLNVRNDSDRDNLSAALLRSILGVRTRYEGQIQTLVSAVDRLIANKANEQVKAVFKAAIRPLRVWFSDYLSLPENDQKIEAALLEEIDRVNYVASLRASINRLGNWYNFDYWHGLGFGTRRKTVERSAEQITVLKGLIANALNDHELEEAHNFLRHFQRQVETGVAQFYQEVQTLGEAAYLDQLRKDSTYWNKCYRRWGGGKGYKNDIRRWTDEWFAEPDHRDRSEFIENEIQHRWRELIHKLNEQLASAGSEEEAAAA